MSVQFLANRLWVWCSRLYCLAVGPIYCEDLLSGLQGCLLPLSLLPLFPHFFLWDPSRTFGDGSTVSFAFFLLFKCKEKGDPQRLRSPGLRLDPAWDVSVTYDITAAEQGCNWALWKGTGWKEFFKLAYLFSRLWALAVLKGHLCSYGVELQGNFKSCDTGLNVSYHQIQDKHWWVCPVCRAGSFLGRSTTATGQTARNFP